MTGPEHYKEAERLLDQAAGIMDADYGWMGSLSREERLQYRMAYNAEAQTHGMLAVAAATAEAFTPLDRSVQLWTEVIR